MMEIKIQLDSDIPFEKAARVLDTLNELEIEHVKEIQLDYEPPLAINITEARAVGEALRQMLDGGKGGADNGEPARQTIEEFLQKIDQYLIKTIEDEPIID